MSTTSSEQAKENLNNSQELTKVLAEQLGTQQGALIRSLAGLVQGESEKTLSSRQKYFNELKALEGNYITDGIYDILINDIFVSSVESESITVSIENNDKAEEEINNLFKRLNIIDLVKSITPHMLHYGAYPVSIIYGDDGEIIDLDDCYDAKDVVAFTDSVNRPLFFFVDETNRDNDILSYDSRTKFKFMSNSNILYFSLDLGFQKLKIPDKFSNQFDDRVTENARHLPPKMARLMPNYNRKTGKASLGDGDKLRVRDLVKGSAVKIRTPKSFVFGQREKIRSILLTEKLSVYKMIANLVTPDILGIPVGSNYDPDKMSKLTSTYEGILNGNLAKFTGVEDIDLTMEDIAAVRCVPIAGDRGTVQTVDTGKHDREVDGEKVKEDISLVLSSLSVSPELFFGQQESKENIRLNSRYAKKVKRIQQNIATTLRNLAYIHLITKGMANSVDYDSIQIGMRSNINLDEIENLDSQDLIITSTTAMVEMLERLGTFISTEQNADGTETERASQYYVDKDEVAKITKSTLSSIGSPYSDVIKLKETPDDQS